MTTKSTKPAEGDSKVNDGAQQAADAAASDASVSAEAADDLGLKFVEKDAVREYLATGKLPEGKAIRPQTVAGISRWVYVE